MTDPSSMIRYVAIGDSFSEGVGDELPDGTVRGWTDLFAAGWAEALGEPISFANFAVRGKLVEQIATEQLDAALALEPTHLSFNGGGNDMLRPRADIERILGFTEQVVDRCSEQGVTLLLLSGGNPTARLPLGRSILQRGDALSHAMGERFGDRPGVSITQNWFDEQLATEPFWSPDRLHMNTRGHHRVAARMLTTLGIAAPEHWWHLELPEVERSLRGAAYYRAHVGPWVKRRITGTSSGDGHPPKHPTWVQVGAVGTSVR